MELWVVLITSSLAAALVTYTLQYFARLNTEDRRRSSAKQAVQAEIEHAARTARGYLKPKAVQSPGGRLSTLLLPHCMPILLDLSVVNKESAGALLEYYGSIEAFNRSLDAIADLRTDNTTAALAIAEVGRAKVKAITLVAAKDLHPLVEDPAMPEVLRKEIASKLEKYGGRTSYDRAAAALGLM